MTLNNSYPPDDIVVLEAVNARLEHQLKDALSRAKRAESKLRDMEADREFFSKYKGPRDAKIGNLRNTIKDLRRRLAEKCSP